MKKIGLLSFPRYFNYGTQLQLYALQTVIEKLGYDCEVIDYERRFWTSHYSIERGIRKIRRLGGVFCDPLKILRNRPIKAYERKYTKLIEERTNRFNEFLHTKIHLGPRHYFSFHELCEAPPQCDAFVCGSDQIWHPLSHNDPAYFLAFVPNEKRIAYAPSIGVPSIPDSKKSLMKRYLTDMPFLSVREAIGATLIQELTGREAKIVLDPTLLLDRVSWDNIATVPSETKPYLLCYFLESDIYMRNVAIQIAKKNGWSIMMLPNHRIDVELYNPIIKKRYDCGPAEFVGLFKRASFVCTDSFHGTVFSIMYKKPFFSFRRYDNEKEAILFTRIDHLLHLFGLHNRIISINSDAYGLENDIDFTCAEQARCKELELSLNYLRSALVKVTSGKDNDR